MATVVADLLARVRAETGDFSRGMGRANRDLSAFQREVQTASKSASRLTESFEAAGAAAAIAVGGLATSLVMVGTSYNSLVQRTTAAFTTILGGATEARDMIQELTEFARSSPFPRQAFISATQQLLGFGVAAEKVIPAFSAIQDAVAAVGGGTNEIMTFTNVLAQIQSTGRASWEVLQRLAFVGVDSMEVMAKQAGITAEAMRQRVSEGAVGAEEAIDMLVKGLKDKFGGAAKNVKDTWFGAVDRVKGAWRDLGSALVAPFITPQGGGAAVEWANKLADTLRKLESEVVVPLAAKWSEFMAKFQASMSNLDASQIVAGLRRFAETLAPLAPILVAVGAGFAQAGLAQIPFIGGLATLVPLPGKVALGLLGLVASSAEGRQALKDLALAVADLIRTITPIITSVIPALISVINGVLAPLARMTSALVSNKAAVLAFFAAWAGWKIFIPLRLAIAGLATTVGTFTGSLMASSGPATALLGKLNLLTIGAMAAAGAFAFITSTLAAARSEGERWQAEFETGVDLGSIEGATHAYEMAAAAKARFFEEGQRAERGRLVGPLRGLGDVANIERAAAKAGAAEQSAQKASDALMGIERAYGHIVKTLNISRDQVKAFADENGIALNEGVESAESFITKWESVNQTLAQTKAPAQNVADAMAKIASAIKGPFAFDALNEGAANLTHTMWDLADTWPQFANIPPLVDAATRATAQFDAAGQSLVATLDAANQQAIKAMLSHVGGNLPATYAAAHAEVTNLLSVSRALDAELINQRHILQGIERELGAAQDRYRGVAEEMRGINEEIAALEEILSRPLEGRKAFSDQRFAIDQQIKSLQLEMVRIQRAGDQFSKDLRFPLLLPFMVNPEKSRLGELQAMIDSLRLAAQELDLTESLQFDTLERQIRDTANAAKEVTFDEALAAATKVATLRTRQDELNISLRTHQTEIDAINERYVVQKDRIDVLETAYAAIRDRIGELQSAIGAMVDHAKTKFTELVGAAQEAAATIGETTIKPKMDLDTSAARASAAEVVTDLTSMFDTWSTDLEATRKAQAAQGIGVNLNDHFKAANERARTIILHGGVDPLADPTKRAFGGIDAHIANQPTVLYGERSTGGEAFIPLGSHKRNRSMSILSEVAARFGAGLVPMAEGGIIGSLPLPPGFSSAASMVMADQITKAAASFNTVAEAPTLPSVEDFGGQGWQTITAFLNQAGIGVGRDIHITSTTGGRHAQGSYHYAGKAVDLGGTHEQMMRTFNALLAIRSNLFELFYTPAGFSIKRGQVVTPPIAAATHNNHVHAATFDQGGLLSPGYTLAYNGTGRSERVVGPGQSAGESITIPVTITVNGDVNSEALPEMIAGQVGKALREVVSSVRVRGRKN